VLLPAGPGPWQNIRVTAGPPRLYVEHPVCEELSPVVDCLWTSGAAQIRGGVEYPILPDGCVDIVFRFRRRAGRVDWLGSSLLEEAIVVGPMTRALWMAPDPRDEWMGVRFRPGRAYQFVRVALERLVDLKPAVADVLIGRNVTRLERAAEAHSLGQRLNGLSRAILEMNLGEQTPPTPVLDALNAIQAAGGGLRVDRLCRDIGISRQHLSREFGKHVGLSPKTLCRILRFRRVLRRMRRQATPDWADLAAELGYYDQAHLISDFSQLCGKTPERYRRQAQ
jgi:AraC-like DNA-binding protein